MNSFEKAKDWIKELQRQADPNIVIALVGNKLDLEEKRTVPFEQAKKYSEETAIMLMEVSAKTATNINELFINIGSF